MAVGDEMLVLLRTPLPAGIELKDNLIPVQYTPWADVSSARPITPNPTVSHLYFCF